MSARPEALRQSRLRGEPWCSSITRLLEVCRALRRGQPFSAASLAAELGVSDRSIKRDVQLLRALGWIIDWDLAAHTYTLRHAPPAVFL